MNQELIANANTNWNDPVENFRRATIRLRDAQIDGEPIEVLKELEVAYNFARSVVLTGNVCPTFSGDVEGAILARQEFDYIDL